MQELLNKINEGTIDNLVLNDGAKNITATIACRAMKTPGYCPCCGEYTMFSIPTVLGLDFDGLYSVSVDMTIESNTRFGDSTDIENIKKDIDGIELSPFFVSALEYRAEWDTALFATVITKSKDLVEVIKKNCEADIEKDSKTETYEVYILGAYAEYIQDAVANMFRNPKENQQEALVQIRKNVIAFAKEQVELNHATKSQRAEELKALYLASKAN